MPKKQNHERKTKNRSQKERYKNTTTKKLKEKKKIHGKYSLIEKIV